KHLQLPLHQRWFALLSPACPPLASLPRIDRFRLGDLSFQVRQLPLQPRFLPIRRRRQRAAEIRAPSRLIARPPSPSSTSTTADAQPAEIRVPELGLLSRRRFLLTLGPPPLRRRSRSSSRVPDPIDLVVDLGALEAGAQARRHGARDPVPFMAVAQDMEERERGMFSDGFVGVRVHEVPGGADVGVGDVEAGVERLERGEGQGAGVPGLVREVDGFVFLDGGGGHVPVEVVAEDVWGRRGGGDWGEGLRAVAEGGSGGDKVGFG
ncbi:MAG: hypothetical protein Q9167_000964, partial [Letrouitia subvulpina]